MNNPGNEYEKSKSSRTKSLDDFQLEEYKNISKAHFEANKQIESFFRHFLIISSAPAVIIVWFGQDYKKLSDIINGINTDVTLFCGFFLLAVSTIGTLACFYLISFRLDSILYARTVNGIRKYFYSKQFCPNEVHYRVLPKQINQPKYLQKHAFSIIVWCFALINSAYFALGLRLIASVGDTFFHDYLPTGILFYNFNFIWTSLCFLCLFLIHIIYYRFIANYRNYSYMKNLTIGIDIDGVLNKHRETFCTFLYKITGKTIWAENINQIPVHLMNVGITRNDEFKVFNTVSYWKEQVPIQDDVGLIINELRNRFGYNIRLFTYRAWPDLTYINDKDKDAILDEWWYVNHKKNKMPKCLKKNKLLHKYYNNILKFKAIKKITKEWLNNYHIYSKKLLLERSAIDVESVRFNIFRIPYVNYKNRFYYSKKYAYRYFVEDDLKNAVKLASSCEYVFLIDHPYNIFDNKELPPNIIRVQNWTQIRELIKELG